MMIAMEKKEAERKWCPYFRISKYKIEEPLTNRLEDFGNSPYCITDMCMKWEWIDGSKQKGYCGA